MSYNVHMHVHLYAYTQDYTMFTYMYTYTIFIYIHIYQIHIHVHICDLKFMRACLCVFEIGAVSRDSTSSAVPQVGHRFAHFPFPTHDTHAAARPVKGVYI